MRKKKTDVGKAGEAVVDYWYRNVKILNILPARLGGAGCQGEADLVGLLPAFGT